MLKFSVLRIRVFIFLMFFFWYVLFVMYIKLVIFGVYIFLYLEVISMVVISINWSLLRGIGYIYKIIIVILYLFEEWKCVIILRNFMYFI